MRHCDGNHDDILYFTHVDEFVDDDLEEQEVAPLAALPDGGPGTGRQVEKEVVAGLEEALNRGGLHGPIVLGILVGLVGVSPRKDLFVFKGEMHVDD